MKAIKLTVKLVHQKEIMVGVHEEKNVEEMFKTLLASENWDMSDAKLLGVMVEKTEESYCEGCEFLCSKCGKCMIAEESKCGDDCEKCHWSCPECGGCMHPEGDKQP